jgi:hypothetical protein
MPNLSWLLLLYSIPAKNGALRLSIWRQLKRLGAVSLKTSASVLPDRPDLYETFQWLAQNVRQQGGDATLARTDDIDGITDENLVALFQQARASEYEELVQAARPLLFKAENTASNVTEDLEKLTARFQAVQAVDYFQCHAATKAEQMLKTLTTSSSGSVEGTILHPEEYQGRVWLTRPRPEVDRVGSAWLIRRYIDPMATFVFATEPSAHPTALPYDMVGVEFGHHGDECTFETLLRRFALTDPGVKKIAAIIHDADLGDSRYGTHEGAGLLAIFRGWARLGWCDEDILCHGFECFDALHSQFSPPTPPPHAA